MGYRIVNDDSLTSVANAIREKGGTSEALSFPDDFNSAIMAIRSGVELNFDVVVYANEDERLADTPKEHTIGIITDTAVDKWEFSPVEPTELYQGLVWFRVDLGSTIEFNALTENCIRLYPVSAKQYVNSTWVAVDVKSYQNGVWVEWWDESTLYNAGKEYDIVTGGWSTFGAFSSTFDGSLCTKTNNVLTAKTNGSGNNTRCAAFGTNKPIDMTKHNTLVFNVIELFRGECVFGVSKNRNSTASTNAAAKKIVTSTGRVTIDISDISGDYYPWFGNTAASVYGASVEFVGMEV